jgi:hypothetical protein
MESVPTSEEGPVYTEHSPRVTRGGLGSLDEIWSIQGGEQSDHEAIVENLEHSRGQSSKLVASQSDKHNDSLSGRKTSKMFSPVFSKASKSFKGEADHTHETGHVNYMNSSDEGAHTDSEEGEDTGANKKQGEDRQEEERQGEERQREERQREERQREERQREERQGEEHRQEARQTRGEEQRAINEEGRDKPRAGKCLFVCCDGTWNNAVGTQLPVTNVGRLARCLTRNAKNNEPHVVYYSSGVGTTAGRFGNWYQGAIGEGKFHPNLPVHSVN